MLPAAFCGTAYGIVPSFPAGWNLRWKWGLVGELVSPLPARTVFPEERRRRDIKEKHKLSNAIPTRPRSQGKFHEPVGKGYAFFMLSAEGRRPHLLISTPNRLTPKHKPTRWLRFLGGGGSGGGNPFSKKGLPPPNGRGVRDVSPGFGNGARIRTNAKPQKQTDAPNPVAEGHADAPAHPPKKIKKENHCA